MAKGLKEKIIYKVRFGQDEESYDLELADLYFISLLPEDGFSLYTRNTKDSVEGVFVSANEVEDAANKGYSAFNS